MHPNPIYHATPKGEALAFAAERGFGTLIANGDPLPLVAHVPFVLTEGAAELHLMRSNPLARACTAPLPARLSVMGADSYISPDWYDLPDQVPTWNYLATHLEGRLEPLPPESLRPHLDRLSAHFESRLAPKPIWQTGKMAPEALDRMMRMILPFRLVVTAVQTTAKFGQNKPTDARLRAADGAEAAELGSEVATLAGHMRATL